MNDKAIPSVCPTWAFVRNGPFIKFEIKNVIVVKKMHIFRKFLLILKIWYFKNIF